ncbi:transcriptional regulator BetI [Thalassotalea piscium]
MPKVGMKDVRKKQLIDATLTSIAQQGFNGTTISTISQIAGVSSGIISHYFGGKNALIKEASIYMLDQLKSDFLSQLDTHPILPYQRIKLIINANFSTNQISNKAAVVWLSFWAQSMHSEELQQLQKVNHKRLVSNLKYSLKQIVKKENVDYCTELLAAQIDGQWLRCALARSDKSLYQKAEDQCVQFLDDLISLYGTKRD